MCIPKASLTKRPRKEKSEIPIFLPKGKVSHVRAIKKAEKEFEIYRAREMRQLESDFDRAVKQLTKTDMDGGEE